MATVSHQWAPGPDDLGLYQRTGRAIWNWKKGDGQHYWAFSIRPKRVWTSAEVEIVRQWTEMSTRDGSTEHFEVEVRTGGGCDLMFNVIKVEGP